MNLTVGREHKYTTEHNLFYYPYMSFTYAQFPLLKVAALWFDKLVILDQAVDANWTEAGTRDHYRKWRRRA
jgi:hypothetical protein